MRFWTYAAASSLLAGFCIWHTVANTTNAAQALTYLLASQPFVLVLANMVYVLFYACGKLIQHLIFGALRDRESKKLQDRLLKYILFKIVFVGSILEISNMTVLSIWTGWFSVLGFLKLFSLLSRDRFEYLITYKPSTPLAVHGRIFALLVSILLIDALWFAASVSFFGPAGTSVVLLMAFECLTLFLSTVQTVFKYVVHLIDLARKDEFWELRGSYTFYAEFLTESLILVATLIHYVHILYLHGLGVTLIHVVLFLHMRLAFQGLRLKIAAWSRYRKMNADLNTRYPSVSADELAQYNDSCAICLTHLSNSAKKLPCGHIFHTVCLRSWLEQNHSCPTCRQPLDALAPAAEGQTAQPDLHPPGQFHHGESQGEGANTEPARNPAAYTARQVPIAQHVPQPAVYQLNAQPGGLFDWLPGFRVQVMHHHHRTPLATAPEEWVRAVKEIFPHIDSEAIAADLRHTRSVDATIDNILHNRLSLARPASDQPPSAIPPPHTPSSPAESTVVPPLSTSTSSSETTATSPAAGASGEVDQTDEDVVPVDDTSLRRRGGTFTPSAYE